MHISLHDKNARSLQQSIQYRKSYEKCISKVYKGTKTIEEQTTLISFVAHDICLKTKKKISQHYTADIEHYKYLI